MSTNHVDHKERYASVSTRREDGGDKRAQTAKPIWQMVEELLKEIPQEVLDQLPTDGAEQHDHYIYGTPKRKV